MFETPRRRIHSNSARTRRSVLSLILRWGGGGVVSLVLVASLITWLWLRGGQAPQSGGLRLAGYTAPVTILRDHDGVPIIKAANELDAYRAMGYLHASERLFQMDLVRHVTAGRLSEWIGKSGLSTDKLMRVLGLRAAAIGSYQNLSPNVKAALQAYADGVNSVIDGSAGVGLPPEYRLLPTRPEPWHPIDSVQWEQYMGFDLSFNMWSELRRAKLTAKLDPRLYAELFQDGPERSYVSLAAAKPDQIAPLVTALAAQLAAALPNQIDLAGTKVTLPGIGQGGASNEWVLAPSHTDTGGAILANDPHLTLGMPSVWYLAEIHIDGDGKTPPRRVVGATAPAAPFVLLGRNEQIAWGLTTNYTDTQDVFIERLTEGKPGFYDTPDGPKAFISHEEEIKIKDAPSETITIRATRHGPVISDLVAPYLSDAGHVMALQAVFTQPINRSVETFYHMEQAKNWEEFKAAVAYFTAPNQNMAYADRNGHIGMLGGGAIPVRKKGDGLMPVPGWSGEYDWLGLVPPASRPQLYDPPSGMIINANNRLVDSKFPYFLGADWPEDYRARRIAEILSASPRFSLKAVSELQNDVESLEARELLPRLVQVEGGSAAAVAARDRLRNWNRRMLAERPEPLIWAAWVRQLQMRIFARALAVTTSADYWLPTISQMTRILSQDSLWCTAADADHQAASEGGSKILPADATPHACDAAILAALEAALAELTTQYGADPDHWQWGVAHQAQFTHPLFSHIPILRNLVGLTVPLGGGNDTVARANYHRQDALNGRFDFNHGPAYRAIYDLSQPLAAHVITAPGQSGLPLSPHGDDLVGRWQRGSLLDLGTSDREDPATARQSLTLMPLSP
ncbi:MAG: penicillin acylase family protein [Candidatus Symbiobacter sp.]|nr:penicillin acylase family protein [Candidatus Symbiobacter sp.]